jgi:hypothetical protein
VGPWRSRMRPERTDGYGTARGRGRVPHNRGPDNVPIHHPLDSHLPRLERVVTPRSVSAATTASRCAVQRVRTRLLRPCTAAAATSAQMVVVHTSSATRDRRILLVVLPWNRHLRCLMDHNLRVKELRCFWRCRPVAQRSAVHVHHRLKRIHPTDVIGQGTLPDCERKHGGTGMISVVPDLGRLARDVFGGGVW